MHVDDPSRMAPHEIGTEHAHEAGEHDQIGLGGLDRSGKRVVERVARALRQVIDDGGRDPGVARQRKPARVGSIADDVRHRAGDVACARMVDQSGQVRAAAGDQDGDARERHPACVRRSPYAAHAQHARRWHRSAARAHRPRRER